MNPRILKIFLRSVGLVAGLIAVGSISFTAAVLGRVWETSNAFMWWFAAASLVMAIYLAWVCYLVWFRFSPRATLHVCGVLGFFALGIPAGAISKQPESGWALAFFIWFLIVVQGYRALSRYFNRVLFGSGPVTAA